MQRLSMPAALAAAILSAWFAAPVSAAESAWSQTPHARLRLVDGGMAPDGARLAGIEIVLAPGFKTYWRDPGESGVPPVADWSASGNLKAAQILFPAPSRFDDPAGFYNGYKGGVVLPVRVTAANPAEPVALALKLDYAVCEKICIPVRGEAQLALAPAASATNPAVSAALARVPVRQAPRQAGDLTIGEAAWEGSRALKVTASVPDAEPKAELFVEGPSGWFFGKAERQPSLSPVQGGSGRPLAFTLPVEPPADASGRVTLRLTLVAGARAIESELPLDVPAKAP